MVAQEVSSEFSRRSLQAMQEAVKNAFLDLFITGTAQVESGLRNAPYKFIKTVLTDLAEKAALDVIFDCSIDLWTSLTSFMDAFTSCALASL